MRGAGGAARLQTRAPLPPLTLLPSPYTSYPKPYTFLPYTLHSLALHLTPPYSSPYTLLPYTLPPPTLHPTPETHGAASGQAHPPPSTLEYKTLSPS